MRGESTHIGSDPSYPQGFRIPTIFVLDACPHFWSMVGGRAMGRPQEFTRESHEVGYSHDEFGAGVKLGTVSFRLAYMHKRRMTIRTTRDFLVPLLIISETSDVPVG